MDWLSIVGVAVVVIGLCISIVGAIKIYKADFPRNEWIIHAATTAATRPSHAVIAPNGYNPQSELMENLNQVETIKKENNTYAKESRGGMAWIIAGFIVQVAGNIVLVIPYILHITVPTL